MSSIEQEPVTSTTFWDEEARSERIGAGLSFTIGLGCMFMSLAELSDSNFGIKVLAIPSAIFAWEAFKLGFSELREANRIEAEHKS